ncbi:hypothetical protein HPB48_000231 [Haemaphysalis longicornis]|uniref:GH18 domain-containing protein n=1 Tax=Haemaphysalis longicornis TaxID=44386 RepID=A0A9J6FYE5_HAELO|nr:hypothetical protein HPB48_000231 [Haemaphysalis longicornis]
MVEGIANDTNAIQRPKYDGVNLDWNHPGDSCDVLQQPQMLHVLVESLSTSRVKVMLTVPPLKRYAALYDLEPLLDSVSHVIVATHKLRLRGALGCSGARASVALGAPTASSPPLSGLVLRPNKTSFESVCNVKRVVVSPTDKECVVTIMHTEKSDSAGTLYHVAAYAGPKELRERMHHAYSDDMGDVPVVVFDAYLDDFGGLCPGDGSRMSPQIAAIAEGTRRDLL